MAKKIMLGASLLRRLKVPENLIESDSVGPMHYMMMGFNPMYGCTDCEKTITMANLMMTEDEDIEANGETIKAGKIFCKECGQKRIDAGEYEMVEMLDDIRLPEESEETSNNEEQEDNDGPDIGAMLAQLFSGGDDEEDEGCSGDCGHCGLN